MLSLAAMVRLLLACVLALVSLPAMAQGSLQGLDHIPIVVRDLEQAKTDFEALGFMLKPGRPHANSLRNLHAKFSDGTELELISPSTPTDDLSHRYVDWLKQGEGPVALGLFAPQGSPAPIEGIFFDRRQRSLTDRPEHFAHPNSAWTLAAAWVAGLNGLQITPGARRCSPFGTPLGVLRLPEGEIVVLPTSAQRLAGRPIVGATVSVASLDPVHRFVPRPFEGCTDSLWVETHGLWLEFRAR